MSKLSFLDKLGVLIDLSVTSQGYVIALVVLLIFGIILSFTNQKNEKRHKALYIIMTAAIAVLLIATYHSSLGNMFQYMMNNFFIAVYFPTIAIYLAAIIAMNIIVWVSIFSYKSSKQIRALNISIYIIMNYIMALLLKVINSNKLDIFDQTSLYGNKQATALIELSSIIFMVWIIFLVLYKIILIYIKKEYKPKVKRIIVRKKIKKLPDNYEPKVIPEFVYGKVPHRETLMIDTSEKTEEEILLERFSKQFTLEDYKLFSRLLKEEQERKQQQDTRKIQFVKDKDYNKVSKKVKQQEIVVSSANTLEEEDNYREKQKQEIIRMEEERRELLRKELEWQKEQEELEKQRKIQLQKEQEEKARLEQEAKEKEEATRKAKEEKEQQALELLLQQTLEEEEREQRKLTELEMLYR